MSGLQLDLLEDEGIAPRKRKGIGLITCGKVLLWMDMLLLLFVFTGLRNGSFFWTWWVLGEGILGFGLVGIGMHLRGPLYR